MTKLSRSQQGVLAVIERQKGPLQNKLRAIELKRENYNNKLNAEVAKIMEELRALDETKATYMSLNNIQLVEEDTATEIVTDPIFPEVVPTPEQSY